MSTSKSWINFCCEVASLRQSVSNLQEEICPPCQVKDIDLTEDGYDEGAIVGGEQGTHWDSCRV